MADVDVKSCEECGASIYPEHINANKAGRWGGKLVCVHCLAEHQNSQVTLDASDAVAPSTATTQQPAQTQPQQFQPTGTTPSETHEMTEEEALEAQLLSDDDIAEPLADEKEINPQSLAKPKIHAFGQTLGTEAGADRFAQHRFKRHLQHDGRGALRCRIFHAKLNDGALHYMEDQINEWIDNNPEVEIKHVTSQVGIVEGKAQEPHLILTLFF